ncbi:MAG: 2-hydroxyacyl-CoA dehydratase [Deltaproteobacteria bacterium]|nr:2-hydroxyacyl-CoA dehydratase [Deltaproteobacteria bacterium]
MRSVFLRLDEVSRTKQAKVAWCTSVGPAEILRSLGFEVFFPENHGALLGASRLCMETIPVANALGYSPDICSYLTSDIGAYLKNITPLTKAYGIKSIPKPDVLVYNTNQCKDVMHWFEYYAKEFGVPVFGIHSPNHLPEVNISHIRHVVEQFKELIVGLEKVAGRKWDEKKLVNVLVLSKKATDLWSEVLACAKAKPSPITFFDACIYMGPIVVLRGTQAAVDFYEQLLEFVRNQSTAALPEEKTRIYWDGMPIWGRLRSLSDLFKTHRSSIVASTYCNSWIFGDFNAEDPLGSMAHAYLKIFINRNDAFKENYIRKLVEDFSADGVIFHESKTCPNNSNSQYNLPNRLRKKGIPTVTINGDLCDLRCFSDEQAATIIEAFLETLS